MRNSLGSLSTYIYFIMRRFTFTAPSPVQRPQYFLQLCLFMALCLAPGCHGQRPPEAIQAVDDSLADTVILEGIYSTKPDEYPSSIINCLSKNFILHQNPQVTKQSSVAWYLSRFYNHVDTLHKASRCDSFILAYHPATPGEHRSYTYHVAMFTFDNSTQVRQIEHIERKDAPPLRQRPTEDAPGRLTFKAGSEYYRVFFGDNTIIFFFFKDPHNGEQDDEKLYAAALKLKDCLLGE